MRKQLVYIGLLLLAAPAIFGLQSLLPITSLKPYFAIAGSILAVIALYGLVTSTPVAALPKAVKIVLLLTGSICGIFAASFVLTVVLILGW